MVKRILLTAIALGFLGSQIAFGQATPERLISRVSSAINVEAKAQKGADEYNYSKSDTLEQIRNLKYRVAFYKYRTEQYKAFVDQVQEKISNLQFKKNEILKLREQLEPYLAEVVTRMSKFIDKDLSFLSEERQKRVITLEKSLNSYDVTMSEKLRRVFAEGIQVEAEYGRNVESIEETLNLHGEETQVTLFRLGRVAMYYISLDGKETGRWNQETRQWEKLPEKMNRDIRRAADIAAGKRIVEIVNLPLGEVR
jgi:cell division septum initiation protein DivIVA